MKNQLQEFMRRYLLLIVCIHFLMVPAFAQFAGGDGSAADPWQISTLEQLQSVGESGHLDKHFIIINDIDASETLEWNDGKGFLPIGNWSGDPDDIITDDFFKGTLNGDGHIISNLYINRADEDNVGLIGYTGGEKMGGGIIRNIGLENVEITGKRYVGGLIGRAGHSNYGAVGRQQMISNSYVTGKVTGDTGVGGIIGYMNAACHEYEIIHAVYSDVKVSATSFAGGLAGMLHSRTITDALYPCTISEIYTIGEVSGNQSNTGGVVGSYHRHLFEKSYWNTETTGRQQGAGDGFQDGITGLTTNQMTGDSALEFMISFDFVETWNLTDGYPVLSWEMPVSTIASNNKNIPSKFILHQNYPNPFNPITQFSFSVPERAHVKIEVFNSVGQRVATLLNENKTPGVYEITLNASGMSSGVYLIRMVVTPDGGQHRQFNRQVTLVK